MFSRRLNARFGRWVEQWFCGFSQREIVEVRVTELRKINKQRISWRTILFLYFPLNVIVTKIELCNVNLVPHRNRNWFMNPPEFSTLITPPKSTKSFQPKTRESTKFDSLIIYFQFPPVFGWKKFFSFHIFPTRGLPMMRGRLKE